VYISGREIDGERGCIEREREMEGAEREKIGKIERERETEREHRER
jgi:hypothetical protein